MSYLPCRLERARRAIPKTSRIGDSQSILMSATLFRFNIATTAAATRKSIPIRLRVLGDKLAPLNFSIF
jgi:hypothetical protein